MYYPLLPLSPIFPSFLPTTPVLLSPPLPLLSLHPSDWVMAMGAGSHPAAVWDGHWSHTQSLWAEGRAIHFVHGSHHAQSAMDLHLSNYTKPKLTLKVNMVRDFILSVVTCKSDNMLFISLCWWLAHEIKSLRRWVHVFLGLHRDGVSNVIWLTLFCSHTFNSERWEC